MHISRHVGLLEYTVSLTVLFRCWPEAMAGTDSVAIKVKNCTSIGCLV